MKTLLSLIFIFFSSTLTAADYAPDNGIVSTMWCNDAGDIIRKETKMTNSNAKRLFNLVDRKKEGEVLVKCQSKNHTKKSNYLWSSEPEKYLQANCCSVDNKKVPVSNKTPKAKYYPHNLPQCSVRLLTKKAEPMDFLRLSDYLDSNIPIVIRGVGINEEIPLLRMMEPNKSRLIVPLLPTTTKVSLVDVLSLGNTPCSLGQLKVTALPTSIGATKELLDLELELISYLANSYGLSQKDLGADPKTLNKKTIPLAFAYNLLRGKDNPESLDNLYTKLTNNHKKEAKGLDAIVAKSGIIKNLKELLSKLRSIKKPASLVALHKRNATTTKLFAFSSLKDEAMGIAGDSGDTGNSGVSFKGNTCMPIYTAKQLEYYLNIQKNLAAFSDGGRNGKFTLDNASLLLAGASVVPIPPIATGGRIGSLILFVIQTSLDYTNSLYPQNISNLRFETSQADFFEDHTGAETYSKITIDSITGEYKLSQALSAAFGAFLTFGGTGPLGKGIKKGITKGANRAFTPENLAKVKEATRKATLKLSLGSEKGFIREQVQTHIDDILGLISHICGRYGNCDADNIKNQPSIGPCEYKNIPVPYEFIFTSASNVTADNIGNFTIATAGDGYLTVHTRTSRFAGKSASNAKPISVHPIGVDITPASKKIKEGKTITFSTSVTNAHDKRVEWQIRDHTGSDYDGKIGGVYTFIAPEIPEDRCKVTYTVKAISDSRRGIRASGIPERFDIVNVVIKQKNNDHPACNSIAISPVPSCLSPEASHLFEAIGTGDKIEKHPSVTWKASVGSMSNGQYTAPKKTNASQVIISAKTTKKPIVSDEITVHLGCNCYYELTTTGLGGLSGTDIGISEFGGFLDFISNQVLDTEALLNAFADSDKANSKDEAVNNINNAFGGFLSSLMNPKTPKPHPISGTIDVKNKKVQMFNFESGKTTYYGHNLRLEVEPSREPLIVGRITGTLRDANKKRSAKFEFKFSAAKGAAAICPRIEERSYAPPSPFKNK